MASGNADTSSNEVYCTTKKIFDKSSCTWTIENLSFFMQEEDFKYCMRSPRFPGEESIYKWKIFLYPCGYIPEKEDSAYVCVSPCSELTNGIKVKASLTFLDSKNCVLKKAALKPMIVLNEATKSVNTSISRKWLTEKILEKDDILKIKVEIIATAGDSEECVETQQHLSEMKPELELIEDLATLYQAKKLTDVVIVAKGTEFKVHQIILSARSPVFAAMLKYDTKEKREKRIEVDDIDPETMERLLGFIYTSQVKHTNTDSAMKLFVAADKYDLEGLRRECEEYLSCNLNTSNVLDILNEADIHGACQLKAKAMELVSKNRESLSGITKCASKLAKNSQLLLEILSCFSTDLKTEDTKNEVVE